MPKLTTEEFIKRARAKYGDRYDYSKVDYKNNSTKVIIICPEHGEFEQQPTIHLSKNGCAKCGYKKINSDRRLTTETFIERSKEIHGDKYNYSKVICKDFKTKVIISCPTHGEFLQSPKHHLDTKGCAKCGKEVMIRKKSFSQEQFLEYCRVAHGDKYDYSKVEYKGSNNKITIICPTHGEFQQVANNHKSGAICPKCLAENYRNLYSDTKEQFIEKAMIAHGDFYDYSLVDYVNNATKVQIICPIHGVFEQVAGIHTTNKCKCPECAASLMGWQYSAWEKAGLSSGYFTGFKLYVIECWNDEERFYKIGKTFKPIELRFRTKWSLPYHYKVVKTFEGSARYVSELEIELQNKHIEFRYQPKLEFGGQTECFTQYLE